MHHFRTEKSLENTQVSSGLSPALHVTLHYTQLTCQSKTKKHEMGMESQSFHLLEGY